MEILAVSGAAAACSRKRHDPVADGDEYRDAGHSGVEYEPGVGGGGVVDLAQSQAGLHGFGDIPGLRVWKRCWNLDVYRFENGRTEMERGALWERAGVVAGGFRIAVDCGGARSGGVGFGGPKRI